MVRKKESGVRRQETGEDARRPTRRDLLDFACGGLASGLALRSSRAAEALAWPRYAHPLAFETRIPAKHPYVTLTPEMIARARERAEREPWAKEQMGRLLAAADALAAKPWGELPPQADIRHRALGSNLFSVAMAHCLSGNPHYAEWVRDGLLAYAAFYSSLPLVHGSYRLFHHNLYESRWVGEVVRAYDMVADSGAFTAQQARRVEEDLLRTGTKSFYITDFENDPRLKDLHFRCYNFQAWHIAAVGMAGLALRDRDLVDWAVNSPYGYLHTIARDVRDDGMFWERCQGYHTFVMEGLLGFTEAMLHCGVDLYKIRVPTDRTRDEDENYLTDTSDRPKSFRLMFEPLFYMTFPDLSQPALGDSGPGPMRASSTFLIGANRYRDPKLDWLIYRDRPEARVEQPSSAGRHQSRSGDEWQWLVYDVPTSAPAVLPIEDGRFANTGEQRNGCTLLPATGLAILRQASGNYTTQPDTTAVSLSYGPHGGGHGHSNNMDLVLYAHRRQWIPAFGSMPYETKPKYDWTAQTISNNTVVVDGISQQPTGTRHVEWPNDRDGRVCGVLEHFDAEAKSVAAHCDGAYAGIGFRRAVRLSDHCVVDAFQVTDSKGAPHQCDYVLHIDGQFEASSAHLEPRSGKLGETCGYQLVEQKQRGNAAGSFTLTFAHEGNQLRLWSPASEATEIIIAEGLTSSPERKMTMVVLRRKAASARFVTVLEPVNPGDPIRAVRMTGSRVEIESPRGVRRAEIG